LMSTAKICRVDTVAGARIAGFAGADFVGLHAIDAQRYDEKRRHAYLAIVDALKRDIPSCIPVLVTRSRDPSFVSKVTSDLEISYVQLHEPVAPSFVYELKLACGLLGKRPPHIIKAFSLAAEPSTIQSEIYEWRALCDIVLFDKSTRGGTGEIVDWRIAAKVASSVSHGRVMLAGGLSADNVLDAIQQTGVWGVDAQSKLEVSGRKKPYLKDVTAVIEFVASAKSVSRELAGKHYRWRRCSPKVLLSLSDLPMAECLRFVTESCEASLAFDGFQLDASDGTAGVAAKMWDDPVGMAAEICRASPEAPLWLHLFSSDTQWIASTVERTLAVNRHLIGAFVQPDAEVANAMQMATDMERFLGFPVIPSFTVSSVERIANFDVAPRGGLVQVTAPASGAMEQRAERASEAVRRLRAAGVRVHLDRMVSAALLSAMPSKPDGVTIGRAISGQALSEGLATVFEVLEAG
jgi:phosphoribosylanthranilate isomerase